MNPNNEQIKQAEIAAITTSSALHALSTLTSNPPGDEECGTELVLGISALLDMAAQYLDRQCIENLDTVPNHPFTPNLTVIERGDK
ncbi:hypothetical protein ACE1BS_20280 [Aeromonas jandaei]